MSSSSPVFSSSSSSSDSEGMEVFISLLSAMAQKNASQIPRPIIRRLQINRDREAGHDLLMGHYFGSEPLYNEKAFKRRFRMQRPLFECIVNDLEDADTYFQLRWDARGKRGFTTLQKCTLSIRQLAYGSTAYIIDDYLQMSDSTSRECLYNFLNNDLNILNSSPLLNDMENDMENGVFPQSSFFCNDNEYAHGYYLADGIYPEWPIFMQQ
ncbi:hypothetical protein E3N88_30426 [Mikania micrantha]|uniref:Uncharacterized protein n=1 Tax=Mikania micrantha TaxID=192012 RepID=A0A5N6MMC1_9ASTR|nr:hypothetical protein E3N88_30426 [Mikania micrantha]